MTELFLTGLFLWGVVLGILGAYAWPRQWWVVRERERRNG